MMRQNFMPNDFSCDRFKETSLGITQVQVVDTEPESKASGFTSLTSGHSRPGHFAARIASRFIAALFIALMILGAPSATRASVNIGVAVVVAPPPLPVYEQPLIPGPGYIWTPGYWAWGPDGYFWVPGTWVLAPFPGELWTPGYWAWDNDDYFWNEGYWGPEVGFYGGIDYGFGYTGYGYYGGYWNNGTFFYNTAVNNVSTTYITNVYNKPVANTTMTNVSFNGGPGGINARPTATQMAAARLRHDPPVPAQRQQLQVARHDRSQLASVNHGAPAVAATPRPGAFSGPKVVRASRAGGPVNLTANHFGAGRPTARSANPRGNGMRPQPNFGHAMPQRSEPMQHNFPHSVSTQRSTPHLRGEPHAPTGRFSSPYPRSEPRAVIQERSMPRWQMPPRSVSQQRSMPRPQSMPRVMQQRSMPQPRSAPPPRMAQPRGSGHPPHGGR
ncbi:MAG: YXWGXW repeat-containing protein [Terriglobia bacterium]